MVIKNDNCSINTIKSDFGNEAADAVYRRVSTDEQSLEGASMEAQWENALLKAKEMGIDGPFTLFEDPGVSATKTPLKDRKGLVSLLEYIKTKHPKHLFVWKRDRLARDLNEYKLVCSATKKACTQIVFFGKGEAPIGQGVYGQFHENIIMSLIETETIISRGRILDTHKNQVLNGDYLASTPPYGYSYTPGTYHYDQIEAEIIIVKKIYYLYLVEKKGYMQISAILNDEGLRSRGGKDWHGNVVKRILCNPIYIGRRLASYIIEDENGFEKRIQTYIEDDKVPPCITKEEFEAAQQLRESRMKDRVPPRQNKTSFLFSGLIKCAKCGSAFFCNNSPSYYHKNDGSVTKSIHHYYRCRGSRYHCHASIKKDTLEATLVNKLIYSLSNIDYEVILKEIEILIMEKHHEAQEIIKGYQARISELNKRLTTNQQLLERNRSPKLERHLTDLIESLLGEKEFTEVELVKSQTNLEKLSRNNIEKVNLIEGLKNWGQTFRTAAADIQRVMILDVVERVEYNADTRKAKMFLKIDPEYLHDQCCVLSNSDRYRRYIEHKNEVSARRAIEVSIP